MDRRWPLIEPTALEDALGLLPNRTLWRWKVAHLLLDRNGIYTCLDLDFTAPSVDEIKAGIVERTLPMLPEDLLPTAKEAIWERFVAATFLPPPDYLFDLSHRGLIRSRQLMLVIRRES